MFYTYSIKNIDTGKFYIGCRTNKCMLNRRPEDDLGVKYFSSSKDKELRQAIKDGRVEYHVLQEYDDTTICWKAEQQLIALYWKFFGRDKSYNKRCDIDNNTIWSTAGLSSIFKGKHLSDETRKKISDGHKGEKNGMYGKQGTNKGKTFSDETRKKMSEAQKGKHLSDETRKKISEANKGRLKDKHLKKFYWRTPDYEIKIMDKSHVKHYHPDWVLIGPVE